MDLKSTNHSYNGLNSAKPTMSKYRLTAPTRLPVPTISYILSTYGILSLVVIGVGPILV